MTITETTRSIREQVQAGIDARLANPTGTEFDRILAAGGARMLGLDGTSVEDAARQAKCAGGPSLEELEQAIRDRRAAAAARSRAAA